jgi:oligosaccharide reducing-end xylanase
LNRKERISALDGKPLENRHTQGLTTVNAVASLAAANPRSKKFVEELWNTPPPDGLERYYEGLLCMELMYCSGEFRIWDLPMESNIKFIQT